MHVRPVSDTKPAYHRTVYYNKGECTNGADVCRPFPGRQMCFPRIIRTDGGPQFRSEFHDFCTKFSIIHEVSSPYHPASNGAAEAGVKAVKALMLKSGPSTFEESFHWPTIHV